MGRTLAGSLAHTQYSNIFKEGGKGVGTEEGETVQSLGGWTEPAREGLVRSGLAGSWLFS